MLMPMLLLPMLLLSLLLLMMDRPPPPPPPTSYCDSRALTKPSVGAHVHAQMTVLEMPSPHPLHVPRYGSDPVRLDTDSALQHQAGASGRCGLEAVVLTSGSTLASASV
jgi:hypothetical protein